MSGVARRNPAHGLAHPDVRAGFDEPPSVLLPDDFGRKRRVQRVAAAMHDEMPAGSDGRPARDRR